MKTSATSTSPTDPLFTLLVCASTGERLRLLDEAEVAALNARIQSGLAYHRNGARVPDVVDGGLAAPQAGLVYPIRDGLPFLLPEDAVVLGE